jgi:hypothetical protein
MLLRFVLIAQAPVLLDLWLFCGEDLHSFHILPLPGPGHWAVRIIPSFNSVLHFLGVQCLIQFILVPLGF